MAVPVVSPLLQWSDADGNPYAGGSIETYVPGTSTPKATWVDPDQLAANTNPVVLDAAGRSLMYGDGDYRLVVRDAAGNLIADFEATTIVSAAMAPVVAAPTIADALVLLGIDDLIAAEAALQDQIDGIAGTPLLQSGTGTTDAGTGTQTITFPTPYSAAPVVVATLRGAALPAFWLAVDVTATNFTVWASLPLADFAVHPVSASYNWISTGIA